MDFTVDLTGVETPEALHRQIRAALPCPEWYGSNLDALFDFLTQSGGDWHITFRRPAAFERAAPACAAALYRLCLQAMEAAPGLRITVR